MPREVTQGEFVAASTPNGPVGPNPEGVDSVLHESERSRPEESPDGPDQSEGLIEKLLETFEGEEVLLEGEPQGGKDWPAEPLEIGAAGLQAVSLSANRDEQE